jgi:hypothetical protein
MAGTHAIASHGSRPTYQQNNSLYHDAIIECYMLEITWLGVQPQCVRGRSVGRLSGAAHVMADIVMRL